jgi:hypothetical protein
VRAVLLSASTATDSVAAVALALADSAKRSDVDIDEGT